MRAWMIASLLFLVWLPLAAGEEAAKPIGPAEAAKKVGKLVTLRMEVRSATLRGEIGFLNYARSRELALYEAELATLALRHQGLRGARGYTRARGPQLSGRFTREHLSAVISDDAPPATFVCGPPALINAVCSVWAEDGLPEPAIETFTAPALAFDAAGAEGLVSFAVSGREAPNSGLPLLEQAEDAGLAPDHGCRMGICNTCSCRKTAGTVRNVISGGLSSAGEEQIRICVSVPVGDVVLDL